MSPHSKIYIFEIVNNCVLQENTISDVQLKYVLLDIYL